MTKSKSTTQERVTDTVDPAVRLCHCEQPSFGICTPVFMTEEGRAMLEANRQLIGRYIGRHVCFHCGGVAYKQPDNDDHIMGETVIRRLLELGIANEPSAGELSGK
jgi:hypothetical protein